MPEEHSDWREVVARNPRGVLVVHDEEWLMYGPVIHVVVDPDNFVRIDLSWAVERPIRQFTPRSIPEEDLLSRRFPNLHTPFALETDPRYGPRVRFGTGSFLYLNPMPTFDPKDFENLRAEVLLAS